MNKKNILIATHTMMTGGCETYILTLCHELIKQGVNISIVAKDGTLKPKFEELKIKVHIIDFFKRDDAIDNIEIIKNIIKSDKIDEVHIHPTYPMFEVVLACIFLNIPYYLFFHGVTLKGYFDINNSFLALGKWGPSYIKDFVFKYAKNYVYASEEVREFYEKTYNLDVNKGILLKNSIIYKPNEVNLNYPLKKFIIISRIDTDKIDSIKIGIEAYIKYYEKCKQKYGKEIEGFSLDIVGIGNEINNLEMYIQKLNYNIKCIGETDNSIDIIKEYDVLIGMGRTIIEGISNKKVTLLISYNKYIGLINSFDVNKINTISFANFSGRNIEPINMDEDICNLVNLKKEQINDIVENNNIYIVENNNISKNIKNLQRHDKITKYHYDENAINSANEYYELVKYIIKLEKDNLKYTDMIQMNDNIYKENLNYLKSENEKKEKVIEENQLLIDKYKNNLNNIYNKKLFKLYSFFRKHKN